MAHTYLLPIKTAAALFPLLALLLLLPTAVALYRRHGVLTSGRFLSLFGFGQYLFTAACMTVVPLPSGAVDVCTEYAQMAAPQLTPGNTFGDIWKEAHHRIGLGPLVIHNPAVAGAVFNLLLLLPLGVFLRYHFLRGLRGTACAGFGLSLAFELTQWTGVWGLYDCPYRLFDVDDLAVNTSGAVLGWALTGPAARLLPALDALDGRALSRAPVPFGRRLTALLVDLIGVSLTGLFCVLVVAYGGYSDGPDELLAVLVAVCAVWFVVLPYATGGTPGKRLLRLRLVTERRGPQVVWRLALRAGLLGGVLLPLFSLLFVAAVTLDQHPWPFVPATAVRPGGLGEAAVLAEEYAGEIAVAGVAACLSVLLPLTLLRRPTGAGLHERLSGVRNAALPPTRAAVRGGSGTVAPEPQQPLPVTPLVPVWSVRSRPSVQLQARPSVPPWPSVWSQPSVWSRPGPRRQPRHARPRPLTLNVPPTPPGAPRPWHRAPAPVPDMAQPVPDTATPVPGPAQPARDMAQPVPDRV
ncbi:VanZ family protein [Streptomyces sp. HNM0575]|uniref:VanZ family protein n=1 Tax=Streptomyces sp. HNM0575 TaxID=2716338 RepID=UPI001F10EBD5|nr:VanZ family protein [Streptomyces sp. HNM0575]